MISIENVKAFKNLEKNSSSVRSVAMAYLMEKSLEHTISMTEVGGGAGGGIRCRNLCGLGSTTVHFGSAPRHLVKRVYVHYAL